VTYPLLPAACSFFAQVLAIHPEDYQAEYPQFWTMPVIALILITVLNDGTIISIAYDNAVASKMPETWNMPATYLISSVLGAVACISSIIALIMALKCNDDGSFFDKLGIPLLTFDEVVAMMYLKISLSDFLTLFSARSRSWFFVGPPGKLLMLAFVFAVGVSTVLSLVWPFGEGMEGMPWEAAVFVWIYCLIWFVIQDAFKVLCITILKKYNFLGYNNINSHVQQHPEAYFLHSKHPKALAKKRMERISLGANKKKKDVQDAIPEMVPEIGEEDETEPGTVTFADNVV
jgi:H+-transporting ATPase